jgi:hypothetical protein
MFVPPFFLFNLLKALIQFSEIQSINAHSCGAAQHTVETPRSL